MSYNGSGTFQINSTGQPVVGGTIISSSTFNALTADLATGLTTAITKDGQTTTTARIPFAQGITSTLVTDASSTTTGSIITAGGVGIAKKLYVGTDANIAGNTAITGNTTITGTLGVTGVATFSATPIYSSLTASSAVATDASKNLVSVTNTGTGSNVLATSPTIASLNLTTALTLAGAAGSAGQLLTSAGSGLPTWSSPAGSGPIGTDLSYVDYSLTTSSALSTSYVWFQAVSLDGTSELFIIVGSASAHAVVWNSSTNTFGTPILVRTASFSNAINNFALAKISSTEVLVCSLVPNATALQTVVLTVSGSTITVGTAVATTLAAASSLVAPNTRLVTVGSSYVLNYFTNS